MLSLCWILDVLCFKQKMYRDGDAYLENGSTYLFVSCWLVIKFSKKENVCLRDMRVLKLNIGIAVIRTRLFKDL